MVAAWLVVLEGLSYWHWLNDVLAKTFDDDNPSSVFTVIVNIFCNDQGIDEDIDYKIDILDIAKFFKNYRRIFQ